MTILPVYQFDGFTFRPATLEDKPLARLWNMMDPEHGWELHYPNYWIEQTNQVNCYVLEDSIGVLFFVKSIQHPNNELEITLQFDRECGVASRARVVRGLHAGFAWLKQAVPMNGFRSLYFLSKNESLISFTEKRMGFVQENGRYILFFGRSEDEKGKNEEGRSGQSRLVDIAPRQAPSRDGYTVGAEDSDGAQTSGAEVEESAGAA